MTDQFIENKFEEFKTPEYYRQKVRAFLQKNKLSMPDRSILTKLIQHKVMSQSESFKEMIDDYKWVVSNRLALDERIKMVFVAAHNRNDQDINNYFKFIGGINIDSRNEVVTALSLAYVYEYKELQVLKKIIDYSNKHMYEVEEYWKNNIYGWCTEKSLIQPWFIFIAVKTFVDKDLSVNNVNMNKLLENKLKIETLYANELAKHIEKPVLKEGHKDLTPKEFVDIICKYDLSKKSVKEAIEDRYLYIDHQTPEELKKIFDLDKCDTYLIYVGEAHEESPIQQITSDPRYNYGDVPLKFDLSMIIEESLQLPDHLAMIHKPVGFEETIDFVMNAITDTGFNYNKLQLCIDIIYEQPSEIMIPRENFEVILDSLSHTFSRNIHINTILYSKVDYVKMLFSHENFEKIISIRRCILGHEEQVHVNFQPVDLRQPTEHFPISKQMYNSCSTLYKGTNSFLVPTTSYINLIKTAKFNPKMNPAEQIRILIKYMIITTELVYNIALARKRAKVLASSTLKQNRDAINQMGNELYRMRDDGFKALVDEYLKASPVDYDVSLFNLCIRHPEISNSKDVIDNGLKNNFIKANISKLKSLAAQYHDSDYIVYDDNKTSAIGSKIKRLFDVYASFRKESCDNNLLGGIPLLTEYTMKEFINEWRKLSDGKTSMADALKEFVLYMDVPYGFDHFDWDFIYKCYGDIEFDITKDFPYQSDLIVKKDYKDIGRLRPLEEPGFNINELVEFTNAGIVMKIRQLLQASRPPKVIVIPCGDNHVIQLQRLFMKLAGPDSLHKPNKHIR